MGNCLITKLKGSVQNDNLQKLGVIHFRTSALSGDFNEGQVSFRVSANESFTVYVTGGGYFGQSFATIETERLTSININANTLTTLFFVNGDYDIFITNKYNTTYLEGLTSGTVQSLFYYDISKFAYMNNLISIDIKNNNDTIGDIVAFSGATSLNFISIKNTKAYGSVESLVERLWENGKREGTIQANLASTNCTLNQSSSIVNGACNFVFSATKVDVTRSGNTLATYNGSSWVY